MNNRQKWNEKFRSRANELLPPERFFLKHESLLKRGSLLDLACGDGRNAVYFARRGYEVTALDFSDVALARLQGFASGLQIMCIEEDVHSGFDLGLKFDTIILSHFKPEFSLLSKLEAWLKPGGTLAICTFSTLEHLHNGFSLKYCLAPREFIEIEGLETIVYDSFTETHGNEERYLDGYIFLKKDS